MEQTIGNSDNVVFNLVPVAKSLDEVVVVGYGVQRKRDLTGAVSVVTAADIANRPIIDAGEALQGKAAGVQVVSNSGKPGAGLSIWVRGSSSISAGKLIPGNNSIPWDYYYNFYGFATIRLRF